MIDGHALSQHITDKTEQSAHATQHVPDKIDQSVHATQHVKQSVHHALVAGIFYCSLFFWITLSSSLRTSNMGEISNKVEGSYKGDNTVSTLTGSTPIPNKRTKPRSRWSQHQKPSAITQTEIFKGVNEKLEGKVFIIGPDQASRYDDTLKALLGYISEKYDHCVTSCIHHKDKSVGVRILVKPTASTKTNPADTN